MKYRDVGAISSCGNAIAFKVQATFATRDGILNLRNVLILSQF